MHWVKLFVEFWAFFGIITMLIGMFWTDHQSKQLTDNTAKPVAKVLPDFATTTLSKARSA
ncbi:MAG TPA: hypothetical protein VFB28_01290 [Terriglobales bacterium]|jgi:hypothetical protein|nr:hypothetical protein [Terriglobales bacterium]